VDLRARGRHDPCVVPRAVPMVESMVAMVLADQLLQVGRWRWCWRWRCWAPACPPRSQGALHGTCT
jgi:hypothetical protein